MLRSPLLRAQVLSALLDAPASANSLKALLGRRKSDVLDELHACEDGGLVAYRSRAWNLTPLGRLTLVDEMRTGSEPVAPSDRSSGDSCGAEPPPEPVGNRSGTDTSDAGTDAGTAGTDAPLDEAVGTELRSPAAILDHYRGDSELRDYLSEMELSGVGVTETGELYSSRGVVTLPPWVIAALRLLANPEVIGLAFDRSCAPPLSPTERVRLLLLWSERELFDVGEREQFQRRRRFHTLKGRTRWDASIRAIDEIVRWRRADSSLQKLAP